MGVPEEPPVWLNKLGESLEEAANTCESDQARESYVRRREQVRRAQRTHRERKQKYIKDLEAELIRCRAECQAARDAANVHGRENDILKKWLVVHNMPLPPELRSYNPSPVSISIVDLPDGDQDLHAVMPAESFYQTSSSSMASTTDSSVYQPDTNHLQSTQVAVDFVLALEQPCLRHHRTHHLPDGETNGHALMIQSPIMNACPAPISPDSNRERIDPSTTWTVPAGEVEKLLTFSSRLTLDGEITPVEAWQRIKLHPCFKLLSLAQLEALKAVMLPEVMCYGFGAVIDEAYFEQLLERHFEHCLGPGSR